VRQDEGPRSVWRKALESALHVEWANAEPAAALRCALGVGVALGSALLFKQPAAGVFLAVGAVSAGFGSFQGAYRSRAAIMLFAAGGMAFSLFVGSLAGRSTTLDVIIVALWGLGAGLLVSLGPAASFISLQSVVAVLVATAYPADLTGATLRAVLVLGGGVLQTMLVVSLWPFRRFEAERQSVAKIYRGLAAYAADVAAAVDAPEPHTFAAVRSLHADPQPFARSSEVLVFVAMMDDAERIRASLATLSLHRGPAADAVAAHLPGVLSELAAAVEEGRAPASLLEEWQALDAAAARADDSSHALRRLLEQVRSARRTALVPAIPPPDAAPSTARTKAVPPFRDALMTIRANLSLRSTAFRHAARLSTALAFATLIYRLAALPRGYWFPMTTLLVMKPEYRETFVTGVARILGTLAGAALAGLTVAALGDHTAILSALLLVFVWCGYALFRTNYVVFTIAITGYVVVLMRLAGVPAQYAAVYRALDTVLGGVLGLIAFRVWPTWQSARVPDLLARLTDTLAADARLVFGMYARPSTWDPARLQQSRAEARLARSNVEASVERLLVEPAATQRLDPDVAMSLLAGFRRYALGALALHAGLDARPPVSRRPLAAFGDELASALETLGAALRDGSPVPPAAAGDVQSLDPGLDPTTDRTMVEQIGIMLESLSNVGALLAQRASSS
jgi:uncharacterized membrane protein YccC